MGDNRRYPQAHVKLLYGYSAGRCVFPDCRKVCAAQETKKNRAVPLGRIAHIYGHSKSGPRPNPHLSPEYLDSYDNWILVCADHHDIIDKQEASYTAEALLELKKAHEQWVQDKLTKEVVNVSFAELEVVTQAILATPMGDEPDFSLTPIKKKMKKNDLSERVGKRITAGMIKTKEVEAFMKDISNRIPDFADKVTQGFVKKYNELLSQGVAGDQLFLDLHSFASGGSEDFDIQSAGLTVLVYLFEKCEVFKK
jgi:hypothetical protein